MCACACVRACVCFWVYMHVWQQPSGLCSAISRLDEVGPLSAWVRAGSAGNGYIKSLSLFQGMFSVKEADP